MNQIDTAKAATTLLIAFLKKYGLSPEVIGAVAPLVEPLSLKKGQNFSSAGKVCDKVGVLLNGLLIASYDHDNADKPIVSRFFYMPKNVIVTSFDSFSNQTKAEENIIAWEPSYVLCIKKRDLDNLYRTFPEVNMLGRLLAEKSYSQALQRAHTLQVLTVKQKLDSFFETNSYLLNKVQNQHIASYLGINRNELAKYLKSKKA